MSASCQIHASCVSIDGRGVLLLGDSGSGKSDLTLRLIDGGAMLVGDDRLEIRREGEKLLASPCQAISGMIEARGLGILRVPFEREAPLAFAVQLVARESVARMPDPFFWDCLGLQVPLLSLHAFDASVCAKIRLLLLHGL